MKKILICFFLLLNISILDVLNASTTTPVPVGLWRSYDLDGIPRSLVQFSVINNKLQGKIVKVLNPAKGQALNDHCTNCPAPWHDKSKIGLVIVWGLTQKGNEWTDGRVLDTDGGTVYRCQVTVSPDNQILHLHAYVAMPMLGRTLNWIRVK